MRKYLEKMRLRPPKDVIKSVLLAAFIFAALGIMFMLVANASFGSRLSKELLSAQEMVATTIFSVAGLMAMRSALSAFTARNVALTFIGCFLTTNGGGTLRDILVGQLPFWYSAPVYIVIPVLATALAFAVRPVPSPVVYGAVRIVDNFSTGVFVFIGVFKVAQFLPADQPMFVIAAAFTGTLTGIGGGVLRDFVLLRRIPTAFATAAFVNAFVLSTTLGLVSRLSPDLNLLSGGWTWAMVGSSMMVLNEMTAGKSFAYRM